MDSSKRSQKDASTTEDNSAGSATASQEAKGRPIKTFTQAGVSASIWSRDHLIKGHQATRFYSTTFERSYRDITGKVRSMQSFNPDDLGTLMSVCQQAGEYILSLQYPQAEGKQED